MMVPTLQIPTLASLISAPARLVASLTLSQLHWVQTLKPQSEAGSSFRPATSDTVAEDGLTNPLVAALELPVDDLLDGLFDDPSLDNPLEGRLHVPVLPSAPEFKAWETTVARYATMAGEARWSELLSDLAEADWYCKSAPGGRRLAELISQGARAPLTAALSRCDWVGAKAQLQRLQAALAPHAKHHAAAHLLAQAHLDLGWARRSAESGPAIPHEVWQAFLHHVAQAEAVLDPFDPIEELSPLLAATRYQLVRGLADGETLFRDWYEDWSDLDPTSFEPHRMHAVLLLPQWFGSLAELDAAARAAMARTERLTGAAAYSVFNMIAAGELGDYSPRMDLPLFLTGLSDYFRKTGCQYRANIVASVLTELHHACQIDAAPGSVRQRMVLAALSQHVCENLREFHLSAWENGLSSISYAIEQVFGPELAQGAHVFVGTNGLTAGLQG